MTQLTDNGMFSISIPEDSTDIVLHNDLPKLVFSSEIQDPAQCGGDMIVLPPGSYELLFCTESASEEDARKVMLSSKWHFPEAHTRFVDYAFPYDRENKQRWSEGFGTAIESLRSLLRSKGCEGNQAVIKKMK